MNNEITPGFIAVLTADVRYDKRLSSNAKLLYAEITSLTQKTGYCWAENEYFAELYGVNERTIQRWLKSLEVNHYISRENEYNEDGSIKRRLIKIGLSAANDVKEKPTLDNSANELSTEKDELSTKQGVLTDLSPRGYRQNCREGGDRIVTHNKTLANSKLNKYININNRSAGARETQNYSFSIDSADTEKRIQEFKALLSVRDDNSWLAESMIKNDPVLLKTVDTILEALIKGSALTHNISFGGIMVGSQYFIDMLMNLTWDDVIKLAYAYARARGVKNPTFYILGLLVSKAENDWDSA